MTEVQFRSTMGVELIDFMGSDERVVEAMLVSTNKADAASELDRQPGRINFLMRDRHGSPFEHTAFTFLVDAPLFVFREWHRHRIGFSYNEISGRYSVLPPTYYIPAEGRPLIQMGKQGQYTYVNRRDGGALYRWLRDDMMDEARTNYVRYVRRLDRGVAREVARMSLGVNIFSRMYVTCNARSLMSFLSLRTRRDHAMFKSGPQHEIEMCAELMELKFSQAFPLTHRAFEDNGRVAP